MNDSDLEPIVAAYAKELSPTDRERSTISTRYRQLQDFLSGRTFQSGSYARFTSTTPVHDLDVIYILPDEVLKRVRTLNAAVDPAKLEIERIVESLAEELRKHYNSSADVRVQPHSVGIFFGDGDDFSIDVVPAAPADGEMFWIPEVGRRSVAARRELYRVWQARAFMQAIPGPNWIKTHPKGYIAQASSLDADTKGRFRKAAKALKKWRWSCKRRNDGLRLKSFHLELAATRWFQQNPDASCVAAIRGVVGELHDLLGSPQFHDLAGGGRFVDQYVAELSAADREVMSEEFERAQVLWAEVEKVKCPDAVRKALESFLDATAADTSAAASTALASRLPGLIAHASRDPDEEFLSDHGIGHRMQYNVRINATVSRNGFRPFTLRGSRHSLLKLRSLEFYVETCDAPEPFEIRWKVKNAGSEASRKRALRGQVHRDAGRQRRAESTLYWGNHYVECYVIKDGVCVAADHLDVPIGPKA